MSPRSRSKSDDASKTRVHRIAAANPIGESTLTSRSRARHHQVTKNTANRVRVPSTPPTPSRRSVVPGSACSGGQPLARLTGTSPGCHPANSLAVPGRAGLGVLRRSTARAADWHESRLPPRQLPRGDRSCRARRAQAVSRSRG